MLIDLGDEEMQRLLNNREELNIVIEDAYNVNSLLISRCF